MEPESKHQILDESPNRRAPRGGRSGGKGRWRALSWLVAVTVLVAVAGYVAHWTGKRQAPGADAVWEEAEQDFRAGRYARVDRALDQLGRMRQPTPLDWFLRAQLAISATTPMKRLRTWRGCRTSTTWPPRRGCWPVRPSCDGTASGVAEESFVPRSSLIPASFRPTAS